MRREEFNTLLERGGTTGQKTNNAYSAIEFTIPLEEKLREIFYIILHALF